MLFRSTPCNFQTFCKSIETTWSSSALTKALNILHKSLGHFSNYQTPIALPENIEYAKSKGIQFMRGRHQSTCKAGKKTISALLKIPGVKSVIIGQSVGGKGLHHGSDGSIKLQRTSPGCVHALMQTSKGVQQISILLDKGSDEEATKELIHKNIEK